MTKGQVKSRRDGVGRTKQIEQAAQMLRQRLAFATLRANGPSSLTVQSLKDSCSSNPSPLTSASTSPSTTRTSPVDGVELNVGLGLALDVAVDEEAAKQQQVQPSTAQATGVKVDKQQSTTRNPPEPSLYDAIFGPAYARMTQRNTSQPSLVPATPPGAATSAHRTPPMRPSPHVRRGSSAQLEKVASSPRQSASPRWKQKPSAHEDGPYKFSDSFAFPYVSPLRQRRDGIHGAQQALFATPPSRSRMRSAGGSLLPNGHPASSLAQDLGIASGSTPRSRSASSNAQLLFDAHHDNHDQAETDRLAGLLTSMGDHERRNGATPPRSSSTFADPNIVTPRRKRRKSGAGEVDGNEAAAHSLLDLAASPSPSHGRTQQECFPGATPSLQRIFEERATAVSSSSKLIDSILQAPDKRASDEDDEMTAGVYHGLQPAVSLPDPSTTPGAIRRLASPPMTPPRSARRPKSKATTGAIDTSDSIDRSPSTSTRRGQMTLVSEEKERSSDLATRGAAAAAVEETAKAAVAETPRTPPPLHTPLTPKAPGSNFCYGEFLHVSPSPQPRMRMSSHGTPHLRSLQHTPSRATRAQARFISYGGLDMTGEGEDDEALLTSLELADVLTPGKHHLLQASPRLAGVKRARIVPSD